MDKDTLEQSDVSRHLPTFDQITNLNNGVVDGVDLGPNFRLKAEVVVEPVATGVLVSVRDEGHRSLISFIVNKSAVSNLTSQVAVLAPMRNILKSRVGKVEGTGASRVDPKSARDAIDCFSNGILDEMRRDVSPKVESEATCARAAVVIDALSDARKIINDTYFSVRNALETSGSLQQQELVFD